VSWISETRRLLTSCTAQSPFSGLRWQSGCSAVADVVAGRGIITRGTSSPPCCPRSSYLPSETAFSGIGMLAIILSCLCQSRTYRASHLPSDLYSSLVSNTDQLTFKMSEPQGVNPSRWSVSVRASCFIVPRCYEFNNNRIDNTRKAVKRGSRSCRAI
jgi:hypothetical protein